MQTLWDHYDKDNNGHLDQAELTAFLQDLGKALGTTIAPETIEQLFTEHSELVTVQKLSTLSFVRAVTRESFTKLFLATPAASGRYVLSASLDPTGLASALASSSADDDNFGSSTSRPEKICDV